MARKINGVDLTHGNLVTAMKLIRAECRAHKTDCRECPFVVSAGNDGSVQCGVVQVAPEDWKILKDQERILGDRQIPVVY